MNETARLAEFAASLSYGELSTTLRERARMFLLDGVGVMLGGVAFARANDDHYLERYLKYMAPEGGTSVVGLGQRTTPTMSAFANGVLSQVLDCQDTSLTGKIHTGAAVIPAALALAEDRSASGREIITAIIAGYEIAARTALAVQPAHWFSGFQATGTAGTVGATAAAGRLVELDDRQMATALGMAGTVMPLSNGDGSFKGYTAKTVQAGQASLCGIEAAFMALSGFTAGPLEGELPRHHAFMYIMGDGKPHLEKAVAGIRDIWHSLDTGFKPYPVGIVIIGPVEICLDLLSERSIDPDDIESIEVITYKEAYHFTGQIYTTPTSPEIECFLSIPFCVAVAIMDGELTLRQRLEERLRDPKTHELAARVKVREDEKMTERYPDEWPVEMRFHLRGGEVITRRVDQVKWSPRRPPGWDELSEKFIGMAESVIGSNRALEAVDVIANLDEAASIAPLMNLVRAD